MNVYGFLNYKSKETGELEIQGEIYKKEYKNDKSRLYLKNVKSPGYEGPMFNALIFSEKEYVIGSTVKIRGNIIELKVSQNEGGFDQRNYLKSQRIAIELSAKEAEVIKTPKVPVLEWIYFYKSAIARFYEDTLPGEEGGILSSMVLADRTNLNEDARELFKKAGLSHILSVSGLHLNILCAFLYKYLRKRGFKYVSAGIITGFVVFSFGIFTGNPISLVRASSMYLVMVLADIFGRGYDMLNSLSLSVIILLAQTPFVIYNYGFALTIGCVLGIILVATPIRQRYILLCKERWECIYKKKEGRSFVPNMFESLGADVVFGISFSVFSVPILLYLFSEIPIYVTFLNILILPAMGVLLILGLIFGFTFFEPGMFLCHLILYYYEWLCGLFAGLPFSNLVIARPNFWAVCVCYVWMMIVVKWIAGK